MERAALALNRKLSGSDSESASLLNEIGQALWQQGKLTEAEEADRDALAMRRRLFGNLNADVATSLNNLGSVYRRQRKLTEAEAQQLGSLLERLTAPNRRPRRLRGARIGA